MNFSKILFCLALVTRILNFISYIFLSYLLAKFFLNLNSITEIINDFFKYFILTLTFILVTKLSSEYLQNKYCEKFLENLFLKYYQKFILNKPNLNKFEEIQSLSINDYWQFRFGINFTRFEIPMGILSLLLILYISISYFNIKFLILLFILSSILSLITSKIKKIISKIFDHVVNSEKNLSALNSFIIKNYDLATSSKINETFYSLAKKNILEAKKNRFQYSFGLAFQSFMGEFFSIVIGIITLISLNVNDSQSFFSGLLLFFLLPQALSTFAEVVSNWSFLAITKKYVDAKLLKFKFENKTKNSFESQITIKVFNSEFHFKKGKIYFLEGKNGCGKTTFLKKIAFDKFAKTKISHSLNKDNGLFDEYAGIYLHNISGNYNFLIKEILKQINELDKEKIYIKNLELEKFIENKSEKVSSGEFHRIMISFCLLQKIDFLFLDESLSSIDEKNVKKIIELIKKYNKNLVVIVVSHHLPNKNELEILEVNWSRVSNLIDYSQQQDNLI